MFGYRDATLKSTVATAHTREVQAVLVAEGLSPWHLWAARWRTSHQPYHNYQHCYTVALTARAGAIDSGFSAEDIRLIFLAGLYHDHAHTGRARVSDRINIRRAQRGAKFWLRLLSQNISVADRDSILGIIADTESSHSTLPRWHGSGVIRDADLLATTGEEQPLWFAALAREIGHPVGIKSTGDFLRAQRWESAWGRARVTDWLTQTEAD